MDEMEREQRNLSEEEIRGRSTESEEGNAESKPQAWMTVTADCLHLGVER